MNQSIRFDNGAAYERYMGVWSRLAGGHFLDWLDLPPGQSWLDVGCGNGAFTQLIVDRCRPSRIQGVDPSEGQINYARAQGTLANVDFKVGDAMALPYASDSIDAAVMPLVIFFVPEPARGVAEMARVTRSGGSVSAYAWDMEGGGFPYAALFESLKGMGVAVPSAPSPAASRLDEMQALWHAAGLKSIETCTISVHRTFTDFRDFWGTICGGPSVGALLKGLTPTQSAALQSRLREQLPADSGGRMGWSARAHAIKGQRSPDT